MLRHPLAASDGDAPTIAVASAPAKAQAFTHPEFCMSRLPHRRDTRCVPLGPAHNLSHRPEEKTGFMAAAKLRGEFAAPQQLEHRLRCGLSRDPAVPGLPLRSS